MFAQRQLLRAVRAPVLQRRLASTTPKPGESQFVAERRAVKEHAAATTELWKKISVYACVPIIFLTAAYAKYQWDEHWEHWSHMPPLEERVQYPYQNIRTKNFPWGDGDKTLFWNDSVNHHRED